MANTEREKTVKVLCTISPFFEAAGGLRCLELKAKVDASGKPKAPWDEVYPLLPGGPGRVVFSRNGEDFASDMFT